MTAEMVCSGAAEAPAKQGAEASRSRMAVGIATAGRPAILSETLRELARQKRLPDVVVVLSPIHL